MRLHKPGDRLVLDEIAPPWPGPGELLLDVRACGVNFADTLLVAGRYQEKPPLPLVPGMEICGVVRALGAGVAGPAPGTRVIAFAGRGGLSEQAVVPAGFCVPVPGAMPDHEAAGFPIAYGTAHVGLAHRAALQPGETLLVLGAAGGVGLTAVELGALMGARVIACARGADRLAAARAAGAHHLIDSDSADLRAEVRALGGADVCFDPVGGEQFDAALRSMKPEGRLLPLGFASGTVPQIPANILMVKNLTVIGLYWGGYMNFRPEVLTDSLRTLLDWYEQGRLRPHVSHMLPLEAAEDALDLLRNRTATGKVVVQVAG